MRQHLIDPEVCIRCNTCEETCPINAITHNDDNYVVMADKCDFCMDCIGPCPTGAIDSWRLTPSAYSIEDQFEWEELPDDEAEATESIQTEAVEDEVNALIAEAHSTQGASVKAPPTASTPVVNRYSRISSAVAKVVGNYRITDPDTESDIRHIVLDFGAQYFPVLEGQSIGIIPPGQQANGKPHIVRLYSVASPRDGERPNHNNLSLTVKRVFFEHDGESVPGLASNYLCNLQKGETVQVTGPFGNSFLMPNDPNANIIMICTGTGSAPFRAMTERRRRNASNVPGKILLFFGARTPGELPYFGPLSKLPKTLIDSELVFSRLPGQPKEYVQDRMLKRSSDIADLLANDNTHVFICGLKGMEQGVGESFEKICQQHDLNWEQIKNEMQEGGRYHVETY